MMIADEKAAVWADGKLTKPVKDASLKMAQKYVFPGDMQVLAVEVITTKHRIGLKAQFSDGTLTRNGMGWKCVTSQPKGDWKLVTYDDSKWGPAHFHKGERIPGISGSADFVGVSTKQAKSMFCRRLFRRGLLEKLEI